MQNFKVLGQNYYFLKARFIAYTYVSAATKIPSISEAATLSWHVWKRIY